MKFGMTAEAYLFDYPFPDGFDPMNKRYEPTEIMKFGELVHRKEGDAFVQNFLYYLVLNKLGYYSAANNFTISMTDIGTIGVPGGTSRSVPNMQYSFRMAYDLGSSQNWGTVVGTGNAAVTIADIKLQTQIANGSGANQLVHGVQQYSAGPYTSGSSRYIILGRSFTNISGGNITVNEMGIYAYYASGPWYFCFARDLVAGGVTINDGKVGYFQYKWQITV